jgi:hypothetical protein
MSKHVYIIKLEIEGEQEAADQAVESALDDGVLQNYINEYEHEDGTVEVKSAVIGYEPSPKVGRPRRRLLSLGRCRR